MFEMDTWALLALRWAPCLLAVEELVVEALVVEVQVVEVLVIVVPVVVVVEQVALVPAKD